MTDYAEFRAKRLADAEVSLRLDREYGQEIDPPRQEPRSVSVELDADEPDWFDEFLDEPD